MSNATYCRSSTQASDESFIKYPTKRQPHDKDVVWLCYSS